jgi:hypothetical protein
VYLISDGQMYDAALGIVKAELGFLQPVLPIVYLHGPTLKKEVSPIQLQI